MESQNLRDFRCDCGKLLFKAVLHSCTVEIKCLRCGKISTMKGALFPSLIFLESGVEDSHPYTVSHAARAIRDAAQSYIPPSFKPGSRFEIEEIQGEDSTHEHAVLRIRPV